jgi:hypothetical protein
LRRRRYRGFVVSRTVPRGDDGARRDKTDGSDGGDDAFHRRQRSLFCLRLSFCFIQMKGAHGVFSLPFMHQEPFHYVFD